MNVGTCVAGCCHNRASNSNISSSVWGSYWSEAAVVVELQVWVIVMQDLGDTISSGGKIDIFQGINKKNLTQMTQD